VRKPSGIIISLAGFLVISCSVDKPEIEKKVSGISLHSISYPKKQKQKQKPSISKYNVLQIHNAVRLQHGLSPLKWSNDLAKISQKWANKLGSGNSCKMYHQTGNLPFGENLFISSPTIWSDGRREVGAVSIKKVVNSWASEKKWYNLEKNSCQSGQQCGHYTQLVWKGTKEVGCSLKVCNDKSQVWVCNYFPAGNIIGARPY